MVINIKTTTSDYLLLFALCVYICCNFVVPLFLCFFHIYIGPVKLKISLATTALEETMYIGLVSLSV